MCEWCVSSWVVRIVGKCNKRVFCRLLKVQLETSVFELLNGLLIWRGRGIFLFLKWWGFAILYSNVYSTQSCNNTFLFVYC